MKTDEAPGTSRRHRLPIAASSLPRTVEGVSLSPVAVPRRGCDADAERRGSIREGNAMARMRVGAAGLIASLLVAACNTAAPSATPAAATDSPTSAPTASPQPSIDVAALFAARIDEVASGVSSFEGTARIGTVQFTMTGSSAFDGPDTKGKTTTTIGGVASTVETTRVAGAAYKKSGDGPWVKSAATSGGDINNELFENADSFQDDGTVTRNGQLVHELVASSDSGFDPAAIFGDAQGISNVEGSPSFFVTDDGTPVAATIDLTWRQVVGEQTLDGSMSFELTFSQLDAPQTIRAPDDAWTRFTSDRWGYSIAYPPDYDFDSDKDYDYFIGPDAGFYTGSRSNNQGFTLNVITNAEIASVKDYLGTRSVTNDAITVGGLPGRLLQASGKSPDLGKVLALEAIVVKGKHLYSIVWFSEPGNEAADLALFKQAISTVTFAP
jgi:hypothetical protein